MINVCFQRMLVLKAGDNMNVMGGEWRQGDQAEVPRLEKRWQVGLLWLSGLLGVLRGEGRKRGAHRKCSQAWFLVIWANGTNQERNFYKPEIYFF